MYPDFEITVTENGTKVPHLSKDLEALEYFLIHLNSDEHLQTCLAILEIVLDGREERYDYGVNEVIAEMTCENTVIRHNILNLYCAISTRQLYEMVKFYKNWN